MGAILADGGSAVTLVPRREVYTSRRPPSSREGLVEGNVRLVERGPASSSVPKGSERSSASTASRSSGSRSSRVGPKGRTSRTSRTLPRLYESSAAPQSCEASPNASTANACPDVAPVPIPLPPSRHERGRREGRD